MNEKSNARPHVVILGAGMGGVKAAQCFAGEPVDVTVVDQNNYQFFAPLLYQLSTGILEESEIALPVRQFFRSQSNADFHLGCVTGFDTANKTVFTDTGDISYDYLIVALGSTTRYFGMKDIEEHSFPMKTLSESATIRDHIMRCIESAAHETDEEKRQALLTFIVVGGGPTGVEEAGAIAELLHNTLPPDYPRLDLKKADVKLIEMTDSLLMMMPMKLRESAAKSLRKKGVDVRLNTAVSNYDGETVTFKNSETFKAHTLIWASGVQAVDVCKELGAKQAGDGRIIVGRDLSVPELPEVYVIGDCAHFIEKSGEPPLATIAPYAMQEAACAAHNIMCQIEGEPQKTFVSHDLGSMAMVGRFAGVMAKGSMTMDGFFAWAAWLAVHVIRLSGWTTNFIVLYKWLLNTLFSTRPACLTSERDEVKVQQ